MSFDIFFQRFENGAARDADRDAVLAVLEPLIDNRGDGWVHIATSDGEADLYASDLAQGTIRNHISGRKVWDVMYELAQAGRFSVMPVGGATCLVDDDMRAHLPQGVPEPIIVIRSGADLLSIVESM